MPEVSPDPRRVLIERCDDARFRVAIGDVRFELTEQELALLARAVHVVAGRNPVLLAKILLMAAQ